MKNLLWVALAACIAVNVFFSTLTSGAVSITVNVITGVGVLLSAAGLWMARTRRQ